MSLTTQSAARVGPDIARVRPGIALSIVDAVAQGALVAALVGKLAVVLANVLARVVLHRSFLWVDEVARFALSTLAFVGGAVAYRRRDHAFVRVIVTLFSRSLQRGCFALADVLALFTAGLTGIASIDFIRSSWTERTPIFQMPAATIALPLTVGMALIVLYALDHLRREHGWTAWLIAGVVAVVMAAAAATKATWLPAVSAVTPRLASR